MRVAWKPCAAKNSVAAAKAIDPKARDSISKTRELQTEWQTHANRCRWRAMLRTRCGASSRTPSTGCSRRAMPNARPRTMPFCATQSARGIDRQLRDLGPQHDAHAIRQTISETDAAGERRAKRRKPTWPVSNRNFAPPRMPPNACSKGRPRVSGTPPATHPMAKVATDARRGNANAHEVRRRMAKAIPHCLPHGEAPAACALRRSVKGRRRATVIETRRPRCSPTHAAN